MVLSPWQSHCESSPAVHLMNVEQCQAAPTLQTKPIDLGCESASSTPTIAIYHYYRQESRSDYLRYCFYSRVNFWGATRCIGHCQCEIWQKVALLSAKFHIDRLRGVGLRPQNFKNWNFTNIIAPKGRVPCTILTKFTWFMRVHSLHNSTKFEIFIHNNPTVYSWM